MKYNLEISPEELERIEDFLSHQMNDSDRQAFEAAMNADPGLRNKVNEVRLLQVGMQEEALRHQLKQFHQQLRTETPVRNIRTAPSLVKWMVAASLFIIGSIATWWLVFRQPGHQNIYSQFYRPDPGLATVMSSNSNYEFEKAMVEYKNGEYEKALAGWKNLSEKKPGNDTMDYFIGAASQASGKVDSAQRRLEKVVLNQASGFYKDACWYLGLCYLKNGDRQKAIEFIEKSGYPQAAEIIQAIKK